jgi:hypothetical protein
VFNDIVHNYNCVQFLQQSIKILQNIIIKIQKSPIFNVPCMTVTHAHKLAWVTTSCYNNTTVKYGVITTQYSKLDFTKQIITKQLPLLLNYSAKEHEKPLKWSTITIMIISTKEQHCISSYRKVIDQTAYTNICIIVTKCVCHIVTNNPRTQNLFILLSHLHSKLTYFTCCIHISFYLYYYCVMLKFLTLHHILFPHLHLN